MFNVGYLKKPIIKILFAALLKLQDKDMVPSKLVRQPTACRPIGVNS